MRALVRLGAYLRQEWRTLGSGLGFLLLATGFDVAGPMLVRVALDRYIAPGNFDPAPLLALSVLYLAALAASGALHYLQYLRLGEVALRVILRLREELLAKTFRLPWAAFRRRPPGELVSRVLSDTEALKEFLLFALGYIVYSAVYLTGVLAAMFLLDRRLALFLAALLPLLGFVLWLYGSLLIPLYRRVRARSAEVSAFLQDVLGGLTVVRAFRLEERFLADFRERVESLRRELSRQVVLHALLGRPFIDLLSLATLAGIVAFFGAASLRGAVEVGVLYAFLTYVGRLFEPIAETVAQMAVVQHAAASAERVFAYLDEREEGGDGKPAGRLPPAGRREGRTAAHVRFSDVWFTYDGATWALRGIDADVPPGSFVAVVGRTGSGKSTFLRLLLRMYAPTRGRIFLDGVPLDALPEEEFVRRIALVEQEPVLFAGSLAFNVRLYDPYPEQDVEQVLRRVGLGGLLGRLPNGISTPVGEAGSRLSSGERHLLALARALLRDPALLLLDEVTAHLDAWTEERLLRVLREERGRRTIVAVVHRLRLARVADEVIVLDEGRVVERGTHAELLARKGRYAALYAARKIEDLEEFKGQPLPWRGA
ncbi:MAG: ABC transporter, ATP-binding/permease protein [Brockia lithotrophica]|uniref:ABC transporter, ATP-binding/permease protein n=1 Tax=Brockia lithotrophica TaxID=933949 RepID=A0A2T5G938_9BACL|nr:MAG: ABC transporter, ATP-binding/permease protein [Brockia lithotrophica]